MSRGSASRRRAALLGALVAVAALAPAACSSGDDQAGDTTEAGAALSPEAKAGQAVAQKRACMSCHSVDGTPKSGPTLQGLAGREVTLDDGTTVTADDEYLRRAVLDPDAQRVEGFATRMPKLPLSDSEVSQLVAYMKELK